MKVNIKINTISNDRINIGERLLMTVQCNNYIWNIWFRYKIQENIFLVNSKPSCKAKTFVTFEFGNEMICHQLAVTTSPSTSITTTSIPH